MFAFSEIWVFPGSPLDSIREDMLTVSPKRQKRGAFNPTTAAATGPVKCIGIEGADTCMQSQATLDTGGGFVRNLKV